MKTLKKQVLKANLDLVRYGLVIFSWGNVSGINRKKGIIVIKPSGVAYDQLTVDDMVVMDLEGTILDGNYSPSIDTPTHLVLYQNFPKIGGVVHTHSQWATSWAQAGKPIPAYGTTHADYFYGEVPCTRKLSDKEVKENYEVNTGMVIVDHFKKLDYTSMPAVLINNHGPFCWGNDASEAIHNAVVLEEVAKLAFRTEVLGNKKPVDDYLLVKHYMRKHGKDAYYGQTKK